jgi:uncharacterized protein YbaP (TraB family)
MKKRFNLFIVVVMVIFSIKSQAQTTSPKLENSLLWEVSGNGLSKPSYLYGTIHMICSADYFLSEKTKKAFDSSTKLILEIDLSDPQQLTEMQQMAMGKQPLSKILSPQDLLKLDDILQKKTGMTIQQVDNFTLFTVMSLVMMKSFGCPDLKFYEMNFIEMAKQRKLPVIGLETVREQMNMFSNAYSDTEMIKMLEEFKKEETDKMVAKYKEENITALYEFTTDKKVITEETRKVILDNRNQNWIKTIPELIKKESIFLAVGSAHLAGESGIINLLRKAGYTVKPVLK